VPVVVCEKPKEKPDSLKQYQPVDQPLKAAQTAIERFETSP
jgi:hypothetical protein